MKKQGKLSSIGHSNVSFDTFFNLLQTSDIQTVIDCRTKPRSRFPQYNQARLQSALGDANIAYEFRGESLGGMGINVFQDETIDELVDRVNNGERIAIMCSEGDHRKCHRYTMLTPLFENKGIEVEHLSYVRENASTI